MLLEKLVLAGPGELGEVPNTIDILPLGLVRSRKGDFVVDAESYRLMKEQMHRRALDVVIDYEHQTLGSGRAPAAGWIKDLTLTDHSIAAQVEWTQEAREHIRKREYRYSSPVVLRRKSDNKVVQLHSLALTNTPAIDGQFAIANKEGVLDMEFLAMLTQLLGLPEIADEEEVLAAVRALTEAAKPAETVVNKTVAELLEVTPDADTATVSAKIMALKNPAGSVPAARYQALAERIAKLETAELIETALKDGKIAPAQREWAEGYVLKDRTGFEKFLALTSSAVPMGATALPGKAVAAVEADTLLVCKALGLGAEDLKTYGPKAE